MKTDEKNKYLNFFQFNRNLDLVCLVHHEMKSLKCFEWHKNILSFLLEQIFLNI